MGYAQTRVKRPTRLRTEQPCQVQRAVLRLTAKRLTAKANQGPKECWRADRTLAAGSYSSVVCSIMRDERRLGGGVFWMPHVWIRVCLKQGLERHMQLVVKASRRITAHHDSRTQSSAAPQAIAYSTSDAPVHTRSGRDEPAIFQLGVWLRGGASGFSRGCGCLFRPGFPKHSVCPPTRCPFIRCSLGPQAKFFSPVGWWSVASCLPDRGVLP